MGQRKSLGACVVRRDPQRYLALYLVELSFIASLLVFGWLFETRGNLPLNSIRCDVCCSAVASEEHRNNIFVSAAADFVGAAEPSRATVVVIDHCDPSNKGIDS